MKKHRFIMGKTNTARLLFLPVLLAFLCAGAVYEPQTFKGPQRIIIIRHAEKPSKGDNLTCAGFERARLLSQVLFKKFGVPDHIYTPALHLGKSTSVARMYQTIVPFAIAHQAAINTKFDVTDTRGLANEVLKESGTVLIVWEHKAIEKLVSDLGIAAPAPSWNDNDFDSIWIVSFPSGVPTLQKDYENIHPASTCP
jgi:hypothetical protein